MSGRSSSLKELVPQESQVINKSTVKQVDLYNLTHTEAIILAVYEIICDTELKPSKTAQSHVPKLSMQLGTNDWPQPASHIRVRHIHDVQFVSLKTAVPRMDKGQAWQHFPILIPKWLCQHSPGQQSAGLLASGTALGNHIEFEPAVSLVLQHPRSAGHWHCLALAQRCRGRLQWRLGVRNQTCPLPALHWELYTSRLILSQRLSIHLHLHGLLTTSLEVKLVNLPNSRAPDSLI